MKKYNYILLDWDGNLAKTMDLWVVAFRTVIERHGYSKTDEEIAHSLSSFAQKIDEWGISNFDLVRDEIHAELKTLLPDVELYPDALNVLKHLRKKGKKLALITSSRRGPVELVFKNYGLDSFFDAVVTYEDVTNQKPDAEPLEKALSLIGGVKSEAIMIGDSDNDLGAAKNAGIDSVLFYPPEHDKFYDINDLKKHLPTYIINDLSELKQIVK